MSGSLVPHHDLAAVTPIHQLAASRTRPWCGPLDDLATLAPGATAQALVVVGISGGADHALMARENVDELAAVGTNHGVHDGDEANVMAAAHMGGVAAGIACEVVARSHVYARLAVFGVCFQSCM